MQVWFAIYIKEQHSSDCNQWSRCSDRINICAYISGVCAEEGEGQELGASLMYPCCVLDGCISLLFRLRSPTQNKEESVWMRWHHILHSYVCFTVVRHGKTIDLQFLGGDIYMERSSFSNFMYASNFLKKTNF